ncbi:MAG: hypothetical protein HY455_01090 [Parcubacteria group bacterium]|nr:hypothetical protein [Parcubacteria group bacterium]
MENPFKKIESKPQEKMDTKPQKFEVIVDLKEPIQRILDQLSERIERGEWYDLIVGDDASGRIPALIIAEVLKKIADARGFEHPKVLFFAGERSQHTPGAKKERQQKIAEALQKVEKQKVGTSSSALLVTDTLISGETIEDIARGLTMQNTFFDLATIFLSESRGATILASQLGARSVISGDGTTEIYKKSGIGGVIKGSNVFSIHANPVRADPSFESRSPEVIQKVINQARADAKSIAHEIAEAYLAKHPQKEERKRAA